MKNLNEAFVHLNVGLPDDVERLKAAGYYKEAMARIDEYLAEDWTETQNSPRSQGLEMPEYEQPANPVPHGVDALRDALLVQKEIMCRLPQEYCWNEAQAVARMQGLVRDFTVEEFRQLVHEGRGAWRVVEGESHYLVRFAETRSATLADLAARQLDPPVPERSWDRFEPQHDQMVRTGAASADITLRTSIGMTDETFARALAAAKAKGRNTVHVKVWLPLPAACPAQSNITLDSFTAQPTYIAPETAPQRTAYWEADLAENCRFGAQYSYRSTAHYAAPLEMQADPVQPDFDTAEQLPHIAFTPYMKALAAQLTEGITDPVQKAKRIYDFVTLNVHYHFQPMYFVHENITDNCARSRRGDCGVMAATFITLCRIAGIPAKWQSGMVARPETAGCHDWAMFYIAPKGWMYADCSAGASMARAGNEKMRLHYFGNLDTDRMVANSDICAPFDPPMCSFRADPCDNQVGEMEVDGVGLYGQQVETTQEIVKHQEV